jgi:hypothetical protein
MSCFKRLIHLRRCSRGALLHALAALTGVTVFGTALPARANVILDWNITTLQTTAAAPFNPPLETRNVAIVHAAIFDAVNSIRREFQPYLAEVPVAQDASEEAAAVAAAYFALVELYPLQKARLDDAYAGSLAKVPDGPAKTDGISIGANVAARILAVRSNDGAAAALTATYVPGAAAGSWVPTLPAFLPALAPGWGTVVPFFSQIAVPISAGSTAATGQPDVRARFG